MKLHMKMLIYVFNVLSKVVGILVVANALLLSCILYMT